MYEFKIKNSNGNVLNLSKSNKFEVLSVDGLYPMPINISTTPYAQANGSAINGVKANQRPIIIEIQIKPPISQNRNVLYKYFKVLENLRFYAKTDNNDVYIDGYVETMPITMFSQSTIATITLVCPDPRLYDVKTEKYKFYNNVGLFTFPFEFNAQRALSTVEDSEKVFVFVENKTGFIFTITNMGTSAISNPGILNETTGKKIQVSRSLAVNDTIIINTCFGEKNVWYKSESTGNTISILGNLYANSRNLFELNAGENVLSIISKSAGPNVKYEIDFKNWRSGI